jgi:TonB family protein
MTLAWSGVLAGPLAAQNVLYVEYDGKPCLVQSAKGLQPCIEINGKLTSVNGHRFALKKIDEYLPVFIAVRNLNVRSTYDTVNGTGQMNNLMMFNASFETSYRLDDVFLLLDLDVAQAGKVFFLYEVGRLEPNDPKPLSLTVPLASPLGSGQFHFHLFVGGAEALHSEISFFEREASLDRQIAKRIAAVQDAAPKPFIGPVPEYPAALRKSHLKGQAVITIRIRANGSIADPVLKSATNPAFGTAALAAAREWRFLPRVKGGHPVESKVDMPFLFSPPEQP